MAQVGQLLSPVIVGRDDYLALAQRRLDEVLQGNGQLLLVSGEAGIGKSRLVGAIAGAAAARGFRIAKAELAPQDRDVLAGSFLDLGRALRRDPAFGTLGRDLLEVADARLNAAIPRRRDLVVELVDLLDPGGRPTLFIFEDLQWADDLTLETLTDLARQTRTSKLLIVGAYRANEAAAGSVLREWRARLVTQRLAEELRLGRLGRDQTAQMTTLILGNGLPAPRDVVDAVYARTDGVPLHIEELCSALGRDKLADSRAILDAAVPATLEDATLARIGRLTPEAQSAARAGAVVGRSFVPAVLAGIMNVPVEALDDPLQELMDNDILDAVAGTDHLDFRHQLLRDALYRSVPAGDRRRYHARAAEFGSQLEGASAIHASVHYERAGMTADAFRTALDAAKQAMKLSSHREAFDLFRRAMDNMPAGLPDSQRARLLLLFSDAAANVDRNAICLDLAKQARELALRAGDAFAAIEGLINIAGAARREGEPLATRRDQLRRLINETRAQPLGMQRDAFESVGLLNLATVELDDRQFAEARALAVEARQAATRSDSAADIAWIDQWILQLDVIEGRPLAPALAELRELGDSFRASGQEDNGVSAYRDVALLAIRALDYRQASIGLQEGLRYAESVEQSYCGHILASAEAMVSWADGHWDEALRQGLQALSDAGSAGSHAMARLAVGFVQAGRGQRGEAEEYLLPALAFARAGERFDVLLPAQWGLAEAALHAGDAGNAANLAEEALALAREGREWMHIAPFAVTGVRALQAAGKPDAAARFLDAFVRSIGQGEEVAKPAIVHATGLVRLAEGSVVAARVALESAAELWEERGRGWEGLWAKLDLASALVRSSRFVDAAKLVGEVREAAEGLGSRPLLERVEHLERVARGRGIEAEPWHPLTTREFEVARKIADGLTNAELADELGISPKTASAHVEHIFAKLGVSRRAEVASWATSLGGQPRTSKETAGLVPSRR